MSGTMSKDKEAIHAAEEQVIDQYCDLSRHSIKKNWQLEPEEFAKLEFSENGYLVCGIESSKIVEYTPASGEESEEWIIEVIPDIGVEVEPERVRVYQAANGKDWIVEAE